jgi:hypothetical protein
MIDELTHYPRVFGDRVTERLRPVRKSEAEVIGGNTPESAA